MTPRSSMASWPRRCPSSSRVNICDCSAIDSLEDGNVVCWVPRKPFSFSCLALRVQQFATDAWFNMEEINIPKMTPTGDEYATTLNTKGQSKICNRTL